MRKAGALPVPGRIKGPKELCIGVGILAERVVAESLWKGPGERCIVSAAADMAISESSENMLTSDIDTCEERYDCWTGVPATEEDHGEKTDRGSALSGTSSESESAGVIVGGAGYVVPP